MPEYSDYSSAGGEDFVTDGTQDDGQDLTDQEVYPLLPQVHLWILQELRMPLSRQVLIWQIFSLILRHRNPLQRQIPPALQRRKKRNCVSAIILQNWMPNPQRTCCRWKKGITADFNGVISKSAVQQGAAVTQGMELLPCRIQIKSAWISMYPSMIMQR